MIVPEIVREREECEFIIGWQQLIGIMTKALAHRHVLCSNGVVCSQQNKIQCAMDRVRLSARAREQTCERVFNACERVRPIYMSDTNTSSDTVAFISTYIRIIFSICSNQAKNLWIFLNENLHILRLHWLWHWIYSEINCIDWNFLSKNRKFPTHAHTHIQLEVRERRRRRKRTGRHIANFTCTSLEFFSRLSPLVLHVYACEPSQCLEYVSECEWVSVLVRQTHAFPSWSIGIVRQMQRWQIATATKKTDPQMNKKKLLNWIKTWLICLLSSIFSG